MFSILVQQPDDDNNNDDKMNDCKNRVTTT